METCTRSSASAAIACCGTRSQCELRGATTGSSGTSCRVTTNLRRGAPGPMVPTSSADGHGHSHRTSGLRSHDVSTKPASNGRIGRRPVHRWTWCGCNLAFHMVLTSVRISMRENERLTSPCVSVNSEAMLADASLLDRVEPSIRVSTTSPSGRVRTTNPGLQALILWMSTCADRTAPTSCAALYTAFEHEVLNRHVRRLPLGTMRQ